MPWLGLGLASAALAVCLAFWVIGGPWATHGSARGAPGTRPGFWWPWVLALAPVCARFVTWGMRRNFERLHRRCGLPADWQAQHWLAARLLMACVGAGLVAVGLLALDLGGRLLLPGILAGGLFAYHWPEQGLRRRIAVQRLRMLRELPFMLDLLTLCVEAGLSLPAALHQVARYAPAGPLCESLRQAAALERTGMARAQWLDQWADATDLPGVRSLVLTLAQADRLGMNLGPLLRAQAAQQRSERFLRAEKLALEAPVRMLFPMVLCIFPCTFLVIGFPVAVKLLDAGL